MVPKGLVVAFALTGVVLAFIFLGPVGPGCLGPLGVTAIQCYAANDMTPSAGASLPISVLIAGAALLVITGRPRSWRLAVALAALGVMGGGLAYLLLRPTEMSGPISTGAVITLSLPVDPPALLAAAVAGAFAGILMAISLPRSWLHAGFGRSTGRPNALM